MSGLGYDRAKASGRFRAKFAGRCARCGEWFREGAFVIRYDGAYAHDECACTVCRAGFVLTINGRPDGVCPCCNGSSRTRCPNVADPVLCKVQEDGVFVPEAGCPTCDPDEKEKRA